MLASVRSKVGKDGKDDDTSSKLNLTGYAYEVPEEEKNIGIIKRDK
jgi:hypothetical protein